MSDRSFEEGTGDQECESQFMIKIKTHASAWKNVWAHVRSVLTHTWETEREERVHLLKTAAAAPFLSTILQQHISTCGRLQQKKTRDSNFQLPTGHFK